MGTTIAQEKRENICHLSDVLCGEGVLLWDSSTDGVGKEEGHEATTKPQDTACRQEPLLNRNRMKKTNVMARFTLKSALAGLALAATLGATAIPGTAHAARWHVAGQQCTSTMVHLNGMNQPTINPPAMIDCGSHAKEGGANGVSPDVPTNCSPTTSEYFYSDVGFGGNTLCLTGWGYVDLTTIPYPGIGNNWNDKISSFNNTNVYAGRAFENTGSQGYGAHIPVPFNAFQPHLDPAVINNVNYGNWNDRISEICVDGPGVGCPPN